MPDGNGLACSAIVTKLKQQWRGRIPQFDNCSDMGVFLGWVCLKGNQKRNPLSVRLHVACGWLARKKGGEPKVVVLTCGAGRKGVLFNPLQEPGTKPLQLQSVCFRAKSGGFSRARPAPLRLGDPLLISAFGVANWSFSRTQWLANGLNDLPMAVLGLFATWGVLVGDSLLQLSDSASKSLGVPSPFFPGMLPFRKPSLKKRRNSDPVFEKNDGCLKNGKGLNPLSP